MLEDLRGQREPVQLQLAGLEQDVLQLKEWASGLTEKRTQIQTSFAGLRSAVGQIEERTSAITKDFTNKVCPLTAFLVGFLLDLTVFLSTSFSVRPLGGLGEDRCAQDGRPAD